MMNELGQRIFVFHSSEKCQRFKGHKGLREGYYVKRNSYYGNIAEATVKYFYERG